MHLRDGGAAGVDHYRPAEPRDVPDERHVHDGLGARHLAALSGDVRSEIAHETSLGPWNRVELLVDPGTFAYHTQGA